MKKHHVIGLFVATAFGLVVTVVGLVRVNATQIPQGQRMSPSGQSVQVAAHLAVGKPAYMTYCSGCHGVNGDGKGPAAGVMQPTPRDFTSGVFKFTSVATGELPTDEDLFETITRGLKGSAMPSWRLLPAETRWALVEYVKTFSTYFEEGQGTPIPTPPNPHPDLDDDTPAAVLARGGYLYHVQAQCWSCHVSYIDQDRMDKINDSGKPIVMREGATAEVLIKEDDWGGMIYPPDFTRDHLRSVYDINDLAKRINLGVQGTAMAGWGDILNTPQDLWAVAFYVDSLIQRRQAQILAKRGNPAPHITPEKMTAPQEPQEEEAP